MLRGNETVAFDSPHVKECREKCNKQCCINCAHFLSAELNDSMKGMLLDLVCSFDLERPIDMWAGTNTCSNYEAP